MTPTSKKAIEGLHPSGQCDQKLDGKITSLNLLGLLGYSKKLLCKASIFGLMASIILCCFVPRKYASNTLIMLPQPQQQGASIALAQLGTLAGVAGGVGRQPDEMYAAILRSRSVQDKIVKKFDLQKHYQKNITSDARKRLDENTTVSPDKKSGLITITFEDEEARISTNIANAYVDELRNVLTTIAVTEAQARLKFYQVEVEKGSVSLNDAEKKFRSIQSTDGLLVSEALVESKVRAAVEIRSQIISKEIQLKSAIQFATGKNHDVQKINTEIGALQHELNKIENGGNSVSTNFHGMEAVSALRNFKIRSAALEAMQRQLEAARVDVSKEGSLIQQIDEATVPDEPSPRKKIYFLIVFSCTFLSLVSAAVYIFAKDYWMRNNNAAKLINLRKAWAF